MFACGERFARVFKRKTCSLLAALQVEIPREKGACHPQLISEHSCSARRPRPRVRRQAFREALSRLNGARTLKMASLIDNYEQQYGVLTADITAKIGRIRTQTGSERRAFVQDVDRQIEEAQELLEQMELEVRGVSGAARDRLRSRVESHRAELKRLAQEFQTAKKPRSDSTDNARDDSWDNSVTEDQKKRLLDTSDRIERGGRTLQNGYRMVLETEDIGTQVLKDLHDQRETIQRSRGRLRETDAELGRGSRLLSGMILRSLQQRIILAAVALTLIIVACIVVYYSFKSKS